MGIGMGVLAIAVLVFNGGFSGILLTNDPFYKRKDIASIPLTRVLAVIYVVYSLIMAVPIALLGRDGGLAAPLSDVPLIVPSHSTAHIQEAHLVLIHILCARIEQLIFGSSPQKSPHSA